MNQTFRALLTLGIIALSYWALTGGDNLGERAAFIQAVLAGVLVWATWNSIDRNDRQIEIAIRQEEVNRKQMETSISQVELSKRQIDMLISQDERHYLGVDVANWNVVTLFNLSKMPVYIQSIHLYNKARDGAKQLSLDGINSVILAGQTARFNLDGMDGSDFKDQVKQYIGNMTHSLGMEGLSNPLEGTEISIQYYYGGTGSVTYSKIYKIAGSMGLWGDQPESPFILMLIPTEFKKMQLKQDSSAIVEDLPIELA